MATARPFAQLKPCELQIKINQKYPTSGRLVMIMKKIEFLMTSIAQLNLCQLWALIK